VDSIFPYVARHRGLLLAAKDLQDASAIALFNAVYGPIALQRLVAKFSATEFSFVLLARSRVQRLASHHWHPNDFWLACVGKALQVIRCRLPSAQPIPVMVCPSVVFSKRAKISSSRRRLELFYESKNHIVAPPAQAESRRPVQVLVLDDVLTSGGSLRQEWTDLQRTRQADGSVCLHALTLFRTPGLSKVPTEDVS
jgi:hypothetical protein